MENKWIPVTERLPKSEKYILLSFDNFSLPMVGRYEENETDGGSFYVGDDTETCSEQDLFVNAWMPLPESYNTESEKPQTNADRIRGMTDEELLDFLCSIETFDNGSVKTIEGGVAMCSVTEVKEWLLRKVEV